MHMSCLVVDRVLMKSLLNTRPPFTTTMAHLGHAHGAWARMGLLLGRGGRANDAKMARQWRPLKPRREHLRAGHDTLTSESITRNTHTQ